MISRWSALNQKKNDGKCCMTSHGFGVKGDDQIQRDENTAIHTSSCFYCYYRKNGRAKNSFKDQTDMESVLYSLYQIYNLEEREYPELVITLPIPSLDFINIFCFFRYEQLVKSLFETT